MHHIHHVYVRYLFASERSVTIHDRKQPSIAGNVGAKAERGGLFVCRPRLGRATPQLGIDGGRIMLRRYACVLLESFHGFSRSRLLG